MEVLKKFMMLFVLFGIVAVVIIKYLGPLYGDFLTKILFPICRKKGKKKNDKGGNY